MKEKERGEARTKAKRGRKKASGQKSAAQHAADRINADPSVPFTASVESGSSGGAAPPPATSAPAHARPCNGCPCRLLGEAFAELLAEPYAHQLGACAKLGITWRTHMRWMADEHETGSPAEAYQRIVLEALDRQRRLDLEDIQKKINECQSAKASAQFSFSKFHHENRFRRFYGDGVQKHEVALGGLEGGAPIKTEAKVTHGLTPDASRNLKLKFLGIKPELLESVGELGDVRVERPEEDGE